VTVLLGPSHSGKTQGLVDDYLEVLKSTSKLGPDRALWLAPSSRSVRAVRDLAFLAGLDACLAPGIMTFDNLAEAILLAANDRSRRLTPLMQRDLLRQVIAAALAGRRLQHYAAAAARPGFVDTLVEHIRELKRYDVTPPVYARIAKARGQSPQQRELAALYAEYEQQLKSHGLADRESVLIAARDALANGACRRFRELDLIVADAFTDFTPAQHEILQLLASRARRLCITLPDDAREPAPPRADLFAKTAATIAELRRRYPQLSTQHFAARPTSWPTIDFLATAIFRHPKVAPPQEAIAGLARIEIVEAAGAQDEIVQLARRIKRLINGSERLSTTRLRLKTDLESQVAGAERSAAPAARLPGRCPGHPPPPTKKPAESAEKRGLTPLSGIVVVFRSIEAVAARVEEVFQRFGIPYAIETSQSLSASPLFRTIASVLKLDQDNWPFRRVVSVVTNQTISSFDNDSRTAADWLVRDLQIASGRQALLETMTRFAAQREAAAALSEHQRKRVLSAAAALPSFARIAAAIDALPEKATLREWTASLAALAESLSEPLVKSESVAWQAITGHLAALDRLDVWQKRPPRVLSRADLLATLDEFASRETLPRPFDEAGRVRVLSAQAARAVPARHLFLAGMSEQSFPAADRAGRLATATDYQFLHSAAHQSTNGAASAVSPAATRAQEEMLLFYELLGRAKESLTISYPALDSKAQELPPSPYVVELKRTLGEHAQQIRISPPQLTSVPPEQPHSISDWRLQAVSQAVVADGDRRLLAGLFSSVETREVGQLIDAGMRIVHARAHGDAFGPSEGMLTSEAAIARLKKRFGPKHFWSPSQFETYAVCPYRFFLQSVLKLEPLGDLALETDFARRGSLLHQVLAAFHRRFEASTASEWSAFWRDEARFITELKSELDAAVAALPRDGIEAAMLELDRRQIDRWTDRYHGQQEKYHEAWGELDEPPRPAHFEVRFGKKHAGEECDEDVSSTDSAFQLDIGKEKINIAGRIDRVDVGSAGGNKVFNIIDYKSGKRPTLTPDKIASGERLQPALYAMAAQAVLFGDNAMPLWAGYWSMKNGITTDKRYSLHCSVANGASSEGWDELKPKVIARIGEVVRAARRGEFPVSSTDLHCTNMCDFRTICRISQVRSIGKGLPPGED